MINTSTNQTTGYSPFELKFGRNPNIPSTINTSTTLTHESLIRKWKKKHEENLQKAKERIQLELEKTKRRLDDNIDRRHPVYEIGDSVEILNNSKRNKLEQSWKGPYEIIELLENNNIKIRNKDRIIRIHLGQCIHYLQIIILITLLLVLVANSYGNYTITPLNGNVYIRGTSESTLISRNMETGHRNQFLQ